MPTKPQSGSASTLTSQRDMRTLETVFDQHKNSRFPNGRPFWGYAEIQTDRRALPAFVCELMPGDHQDPMGSGHNPPWLPTQMRESNGRRYLELNMRERKLKWNYALIIADDKLARLNYYRAAAKIANANGWKAPGMNEPVSFQIQSILLDPPRDPRVAEAALAQDPWILGFTEEVNPTLQALLATGLDWTVAGNAAPVQVKDALRIGEGDDDLDARIAKIVAQAIEHHDAEKARVHAEKVKAGKANAASKKKVAA